MAAAQPAAAQDPAPSPGPAAAGYPLTPGVSAEPIASEFVLGGYAQAQYETHQDSIDQQRQGGALINADRFLLRRTRLRVTRDWPFAQVVLELDGNTVRGPAMRVQKAELSVLYGRSRDKDQPPLVQLTLGQFDVPFGFEMVYGPKVRWFTERSSASRAMFPGEPDVGARLSGGLGFVRYALAVTNGEPSDEKSGFSLQDPNANKDVSARLGAEAKAAPWLIVAGGVSANAGRGFHPATDVTKNSLGWKDMNENGRVDNLIEVVGAPAMVGTPAQNFSRWGVGADLELLLHTRLGWTMLYGELVAASNLDRGLVVADPVLNKGSALRELGYYIALTQEVMRYGLVGFRYDSYDPNADFLDKRAGRLIPTSQKVRTFSPLLGLTLPGYARLTVQWDVVRDKLARDERGVPSDLRNDQWTLRLQVSL